MRVLARDPEWTVEAVAAEAGVSEKLLYYYYPGGVLEALAEQIANQHVAQISEFFSGIPTELPSSSKQLRAAVKAVVSSAVDWVESVSGAWMFGPERDRLSSAVGERWDTGQRAIAAALAAVYPHAPEDSDAVTAVIYAELIGFQTLAYEFKCGRLSRVGFQAVASSRFESLFLTALPSLSA